MPPRALAEIAAIAGAELRGNGALIVTGLAPLETAGPSELAAFHHPRYAAAFAATRAGAVVVGAAAAAKRAGDAQAAGGARPALLVAPDPYLAFARIAAALYPLPIAQPGIHPRAVVEDGASVDPSAEIGPLCVIGSGAHIGPRCLLVASVHIGRGAHLGGDCRLGPGAVVADGCSLGERVILQPGAVIGSDGFGYARAPESGHLKIPQIGTVRVEDDVEIGAHSCVDRATLGETVIGRGSKIDNLVQIAHNVRVGPQAIVCAQAGIAGSTTLGRGVVLGGQVGLVGHLAIGDGARFGAGTGVMDDVAAGDTRSGQPSSPHHAWLRQVAATRKLPAALRELSELRRRLAALEERLAAPEPLPK